MVYVNLLEGNDPNSTPQVTIQLLQDRCQWGQEDCDGSFRQTQAPLHGGHVHRASTQCPWDLGMDRILDLVGSGKSSNLFDSFEDPIGSMYGIYGNIYHQYTPNVSIYTIHGSYGDV